MYHPARHHWIYLSLQRLARKDTISDSRLLVSSDHLRCRPVPSPMASKWCCSLIGDSSRSEVFRAQCGQIHAGCPHLRLYPGLCPASTSRRFPSVPPDPASPDNSGAPSPPCPSSSHFVTVRIPVL